MQMLSFVVEYLGIHVFKHLFTVSSVVNTNLLIFFVFKSSFRFSIVDDITFTLIGFNIEYCCISVDDLLNTIHKNVVWIKSVFLYLFIWHKFMIYTYSSACFSGSRFVISWFVN